MANHQPQLINSSGLSLAVVVVISAFSGVAWYICTSLWVKIIVTFKKYRSVYFWALIVSATSTFLMPVCYMLKDFKVANVNAIEIVCTLSWYGMVTGQAVVLYSRLHLIVSDRRKIIWILYMIIFNFCVLHIPTTLLTYASQNPKLAGKFSSVYSIYEKIQMTGFFLQETTISGVYIWETRRILKVICFIDKKESRDVMQHLIYVNVFIVILDLALLSTEFAGFFRVQTVFKAVVYAIKLDLEFSILNRLRKVVLSRGTNSSARENVSNVARPNSMPLTNIKPSVSEGDSSTSGLVEPSVPTVATHGDGITRITEIEVNTLYGKKERDDEKLVTP